MFRAIITSFPTFPLFTSIYLSSFLL
jgi:hypothetical protein